MQLKSRQVFRGTITAAAATVITITPVADAASIASLTYRNTTASDAVEDFAVRATFSKSGSEPAGTWDRLTLARDGTLGDVNYSVQVLEFGADTTVQQVTYSIANAASAPATQPTIDAVVLAETFVIQNYSGAGMTASNSGDPPNDALVRLKLDTTTSLNLARVGTTGTIQGTAFVVSSDTLTVQQVDMDTHSALSANPGSFNTAITAVTEANSFIVGSCDSSESAYPDEGYPSYHLDGGNIRTTGGYDPGANIYGWTVFVVSDPAINTFQYVAGGKAATGAALVTATATPINSVHSLGTNQDLLGVFPNQPACQPKASTEYQANEMTFRMFEAWISSDTQVTNQKAGEGAASYHVVEFEAADAGATATLDTALAPATLAGAALVEISASLGSQVVDVSAATAARADIVAALGSSLAPQTLAATATAEISAVHAALLSEITANASAEIPASVELSVVLPDVTLAGSAAVDASAALAAAVDAITTTADLEVPLSAVLSIAVADTTLSAFIGAIVSTAAADISLSDASVTSATQADIAAALDENISSVESSAQAKADILAALSASLSSATLAANAEVVASGLVATLSASLDPVTLAGGAQIDAAAALSASLAPTTVAGRAGVDVSVSADIAMEITSLSAAAQVPLSAFADVALSDINLSAAVEVTDPGLTMALSGTLGEVTGNAAAVADVNVQVNATLDGVNVSSLTATEIRAALLATLGDTSSTAAAALRVQVATSVILEGVTLDALNTEDQVLLLQSILDEVSINAQGVLAALLGDITGIKLINITNGYVLTRTTARYILTRITED